MTAQELSIDEITKYINETFPGVDIVIACAEDGAPECAWGDVFYFYDPDRSIPPTKRMPFATIVQNNYPGFDEQSKLNRTGIYRLNIGLDKKSYGQRFAAVDTVENDFAALDQIMPHPVYGIHGWACVLNPSQHSFDAISELLAIAYQKSKHRTE